MSTYTVTVKEICDAGLGFETPSTYTQLESVLNYGSKNLFEKYAIFDENYRDVLNKQIIGHYLNHEIGLETVALWKFELNQRMREIMPYYNQLYKSTMFEIDPFSNMDYTVQHDGESHDVQKSKQNTVDETIQNSEKNGSNTGWYNSTKNDKNSYNSTKTHSADDDTLVTNNIHDKLVNKGEDTTTHTYNDTVKNTKDNLKTTDNYNNLATVESGDVIHQYNSTTKSDSRTVFSDTPQGILLNPDSVEFATNVTNVSDTVKKTGEDTDQYRDKKTQQSGSVDHTTTGGETTEHTGTISDSVNHGLATDTDHTGTVKTERDVSEMDTTADYTIHDSTVRDAHSDTVRDTAKNETNTTKQNILDDKKDNENEYLDKYKGRNGITMAEALQKYRETLINIDLMIINDLRDLFMLIY